MYMCVYIGIISRVCNIALFSFGRQYSRWIQNFPAKIRSLSKNTVFPLPSDVSITFQQLKDDIASAAVSAVDPDLPLVVEKQTHLTMQ